MVTVSRAGSKSFRKAYIRGGRRRRIEVCRAHGADDANRASRWPPVSAVGAVAGFLWASGLCAASDHCERMLASHRASSLQSVYATTPEEPYILCGRHMPGLLIHATECNIQCAGRRVLCMNA
eukprot:2186560-Pleurochrysis_carterae.AAC.3